MNAAAADRDIKPVNAPELGPPLVIEFTDDHGALVTLLVDAIESVSQPEHASSYTHVRTRSGGHHNIDATYDAVVAIVCAHANHNNPAEIVRRIR